MKYNYSKCKVQGFNTLPKCLKYTNKGHNLLCLRHLKYSQENPIQNFATAAIEFRKLTINWSTELPPNNNNKNEVKIPCHVFDKTRKETS
jgi:hypothetical protein